MAVQKLHFKVAGGAEFDIEVNRLVIAGWTGRDVEAVNHHIRELEALGVRPPVSVPTFYPLAVSLLTTAEVIEVPRRDSSGEVECVLFSSESGLYVGVGSDHTDRKVEAYDVTVSKQMCAKPVGREVWLFDEVAAHWDRLDMRCWRTRHGVQALYQEGCVTRLLDPRDLVKRLTGKGSLPVGTALFGGTQAVVGELGYGEAFEIELYDPVLKRSLRHAYRVSVLEVAE